MAPRRWLARRWWLGLVIRAGRAVVLLLAAQLLPTPSLLLPSAGICPTSGLLSPKLLSRFDLRAALDTVLWLHAARLRCPGGSRSEQLRHTVRAAALPLIAGPATRDMIATGAVSSAAYPGAPDEGDAANQPNPAPGSAR